MNKFLHFIRFFTILRFTTEEAGNQKSSLIWPSTLHRKLIYKPKKNNGQSARFDFTYLTYLTRQENDDDKCQQHTTTLPRKNQKNITPQKNGPNGYDITLYEFMI